MGLFSFLKNKKTNQSIKLDSYDEDLYFEEHYLDKAEILYEHYTDACDKVSDCFYDVFDYNKRIKMLENAVGKYTEWKDFCLSNGAAGKRFFDEEASRLFSNYHYIKPDRTLSEKYIAEYRDADFQNINFLMDVLNEYKSDPDGTKKHLHDEHVFFCGGQSCYDRMIKINNLPKDILKILRKKGPVLQKDLYSMYDPDFKNHIIKAVNKLTDSGKIVKTKSGNSYKLSINPNK